jgi:hypothetical protein
VDLMKIDSAKTLISEIGIPYSKFFKSYVSRVEVWGGEYSTCHGETGKKGVIFLSMADVKSGNVHNIAAAIIHETMHLYFRYKGEAPEKEEAMCYYWEYDFLQLIPDVDPALVYHAITMAEQFTGEDPD